MTYDDFCREYPLCQRDSRWGIFLLVDCKDVTDHCHDTFEEGQRAHESAWKQLNAFEKRKADMAARVRARLDSGKVPL